MEPQTTVADAPVHAVVHDAVSHTPGPWTVRRHVDTVTGESYKTLYESHVSIEPDVCAIWAPPLNQEREANARLIAAAPELLAVAKAVLQSYVQSGDVSAMLFNELDAAIRKATVGT